MVAMNYFLLITQLMRLNIKWEFSLQVAQKTKGKTKVISRWDLNISKWFWKTLQSPRQPFCFLSYAAEHVPVKRTSIKWRLCKPSPKLMSCGWCSRNPAWEVSLHTPKLTFFKTVNCFYMDLLLGSSKHIVRPRHLCSDKNLRCQPMKWSL